MPANGKLALKYLGHSTFLFTTPGGGKLLIDPWVMNNPACPEGDKRLESVDAMLITHGHFDHIHDAVEIANRFKPQIGCIFEISKWLEKKGVDGASAMNKGGSQQIGDIRVTMVDARHSCGILDDDGSIIYGGEAAGFVVEFENGLKIYHAGDTAVFGDMKIIAELYEPDVVFLPIGDLFTMGPKEAAYACRLMGARKVVPMHYGTFPPLVGTPRELRERTRDLGTEVLEVRPGETLQL
jgi:L-ascorbate metabolism protein UlaG (beta-lactamase superfamily)